MVPCLEQPPSQDLLFILHLLAELSSLGSLSKHIQAELSNPFLVLQLYLEHFYWCLDLRVLCNCVYTSVSSLEAKGQLNHHKKPVHIIIICLHVYKLLESRIWVFLMPYLQPGTDQSIETLMPASMLVNKTDNAPNPATWHSGRGTSITHIKAKQKNRNISDSGKCYEKNKQGY